MRFALAVLLLLCAAFAGEPLGPTAPQPARPGLKIATRYRRVSPSMSNHQVGRVVSIDKTTEYIQIDRRREEFGGQSRKHRSGKVQPRANQASRRSRESGRSD